MNTKCYCKNSTQHPFILFIDLYIKLDFKLHKIMTIPLDMDLSTQAAV